MQRIKRYLLGTSIVVILLHAVVAQTGADVARVQTLLGAARTALGGPEKLQSVQSLTVTGQFRRVMMMQVKSDGGSAPEAPPQMSGEINLAFAMPDKFMKTHDIDLPMGGAITETVAFDGAQAWSDVHSDGGGHVIIRRPGAEGSGGGAPGEGGGQRLRAEFARYMLALLLNAPAEQQIAWTYAGEAQADDGHADVLDCKGANGFNARLFLDQGTHRPLMLTYRSNEPVMRMMMRTGPPPAGGGGGSTKVETKDVQVANMPPPEMKETETEVRFGDYRAVDGIIWTHQITFASAGTVNEEWEIKTFKVNPQFKADKFQKKGK